MSERKVLDGKVMEDGRKQLIKFMKDHPEMNYNKIFKGSGVNNQMLQKFAENGGNLGGDKLDDLGRFITNYKKDED